MKRDDMASGSVALTEVSEGMTIDVRHGAAAPMFREITRVQTKRDKFGEWVYLYWKPQGMTPEGKPDCGYTGLVLNDERRQYRYAIAAAQGGK